MGWRRRFIFWKKLRRALPRRKNYQEDEWSPSQGTRLKITVVSKMNYYWDLLKIFLLLSPRGTLNTTRLKVPCDMGEIFSIHDGLQNGPKRLCQRHFTWYKPQNCPFVFSFDLGHLGFCGSPVICNRCRNLKMAQFSFSSAKNGQFWGLYHVNCLCHSLFGSFWGPSVLNSIQRILFYNR